MPAFRNYHIAFLITFAFMYLASAQTAADQAAPAPGILVDVGGRKLHLYCTGKGSPTVILEAGAGSFSIDWALVQPDVAKTTRVCSYDRASRRLWLERPRP